MSSKPNITGKMGLIYRLDGDAVVSFGEFKFFTSGAHWHVDCAAFLLQQNRPRKQNPNEPFTLKLVEIIDGSRDEACFSIYSLMAMPHPEDDELVRLSGTFEPLPLPQPPPMVYFPLVGGPFRNGRVLLEPNAEACELATVITYRYCLEDREIEGLTGKEPHWYPPGPTRVSYRYVRKTLEHKGRNYEVFAYAPMDLKRFAKKAGLLADQGKL